MEGNEHDLLELSVKRDNICVFGQTVFFFLNPFLLNYLQEILHWILLKSIDHLQKFEEVFVNYVIYAQCMWVRSQNCGFLVTWFCYQLIAKPGNKTAAVSWPDPSTQSLFNSFHWIYSLLFSHTILGHISGSTSTLVMACCLTAPSHYLNQCWLSMDWVLWHSPESNFMVST